MLVGRYVVCQNNDNKNVVDNKDIEEGIAIEPANKTFSYCHLMVIVLH
jgi:hypothetical protein